MIEEVVQSLEAMGCKTLLKENFSTVVQCGNSFVIKSPSNKWSLMVPAPKLSQIRSKISKNNHSQYIDVGKFIRNGGWGRIFEFHIGNEINYSFTEKNMKDIPDLEIKNTLQEMEDQKKYFNEDIREFNIQEDYNKNVEKLGIKLEKIISTNLKSELRTPIICHPNAKTQKFFAPNGEKIMWKIKVSCVVPGVKQSVENSLGSILESGMISQYDTRFVSSMITKDKNFMLSGIHLYQKGYPYPMLKFSIKNEEVITKEKDFLVKKDELEKSFRLKDEKELKKIDLDVFTRHLL